MREMLVPLVIKRRHQPKGRVTRRLNPSMGQFDPRATFNRVQFSQQLCHHATKWGNRELLAQPMGRIHFQYFTPTPLRAFFLTAMKGVSRPQFKIRIGLEKPRLQLLRFG